ncbi:hypothetical protein [Roseibium sp. MMSF_3412]|uniref:hypothetical protein n=1 Tax=Roseibium sp. MMSF_3412 TaxID=3046712 RepID=UPI00273D7BA6|nr:hypothetical protein [Roseibium sp. MMSF_3412]
MTNQSLNLRRTIVASLNLLFTENPKHSAVVRNFDAIWRVPGPVIRPIRTGAAYSRTATGHPIENRSSASSPTMLKTPPSVQVLGFQNGGKVTLPHKQTGRKARNAPCPAVQKIRSGAFLSQSTSFFLRF